MVVKTEGRHAAEFVLSEAQHMRSRDNITILSGSGVVKVGTPLALESDDGDVTATVTQIGGGKGDVTMADPATGSGVKEGNYEIVILEEASDAGDFEVRDPDGLNVGAGTVGVAFDGVIKFTLADGGTDFSAGDRATVNISIASGSSGGRYAPAEAGGDAVALNLYQVDATSADVEVSAITRDAEVNGKILEYHTSIDDASKEAAINASLAIAGIIVR